MHLLRNTCLAAASLALGLAAHAQRLPHSAIPEHYTLALAPDLKSATFTGVETIELQLAQPSNTITLNAAEITFEKVTAESGGQPLTAKVSEDAATEQATFTFDKPLPAGRVLLHIDYSGILNGQLRGFYLSKSEKRSYAVTQFEPTDARRAFPCFDEPAVKATFDVSLTVDKGDTAISNTNIVSDTPAPSVSGEAKHTLHFATTPKMSTYLVAFLVGDFVCTSGSSDGVPIRACATPDKLALTPYAVKAAEFVLHYYDDYFGIKYPMPKLDMIAIPDFEAGAMENFGAITYRETDFLVDEQHASEDSKERVAQVVAHEMAHQWFGDMVTMQWWNNLWLNEGFATWMENKPIAAWRPEWNVPEQVASSLNSTLNLDAAAVTRTIRAEANTPDEINEMFDGITYQKGGAVLDMVENYVGPGDFRKGVHNYLQAHLFGNATAEDFWTAETAASHKPVDKVMESFIAQPGEPVLTFADGSGLHVGVTQQRFFLSPGAARAHEGDKPQLWTIPVCIKGEATAACPLLSTSPGELAAGSQDYFFANAGGVGYYRSVYPAGMYAKLLLHVERELTPTERISLIGDEWAQVRAGKQPVGASLDLAYAVKSDPSVEVIDTSLNEIGAIGARIAATPQERDALKAWVRATYKPEFDKLGMPAANDTPATRALRALLLGALGAAGDPGIIAIARHLTELYLADPNSIDPSLVSPVLEVAAANGDATLFDQLQKVFETSNDPTHKTQALDLLAAFKQPALIDRAIDYAASGKVRNQDSIFVFARTLGNPETHDEAWRYIQANWPKVQAQLTEMMGGYLVSATGSFCTADKSQEVQAFFTAHPVHAAERALARARSQISDCIELRTAQEANLQGWLAKQK
jgi:aminopeptidase N/puromycin-sensitive aminopeptidase